jgi:hypothetical protein
VLVKPVRCKVGCRHDHDPGVEEGVEQAPEDHRVGDVVDLELVEAQQRRLVGDVGGDLEDRRIRLRPPLSLDAVVHFEHEGMEMNPPLAQARHRGKEQIHQHRFAAADRAVQIEPHRHVAAAVLGEAEAREPAAPPVSGR